MELDDSRCGSVVSPRSMGSTGGSEDDEADSSCDWVAPVGAGLAGGKEGDTSPDTKIRSLLGMYGADSFLEYWRDSGSSSGPRK